MMNSNSPVSFLVLLTFCFASLGCMSQRGSDQPDLGRVQGTVTIDGKPFAGVIIVFTPELGRQSTGLIDDDGKYELEYLHHSKGAKVGRHTIGFAAPTDASNGIQIPKAYAYGTDTGLDAIVKAGANTFDFALKSGAR